MDNKSKEIFETFITELGAFERNLSEENVADFIAWKTKVAEFLDGAYRSRFLSLNFFEKAPNLFDDNIPF